MIPAPFDTLPATAQSHTRLHRDETAFLQNDPAAGLWYVQSGEVALIRHTEAGHRVILHRAKAGATLAEASLFSDRYHCDCHALSASHLIRFDKSAVLAQVHHDGAFALALTARLACQVQGYRRQIEVLAIRSAEDRVLIALSDWGQDGSVTDFAARIGLTHETTYRALSRLVRAGKVHRLARGRYRVSLP